MTEYNLSTQLRANLKCIIYRKRPGMISHLFVNPRTNMFGLGSSHQENTVDVDDTADDNLLAERLPVDPRSMEPLFSAQAPEPPSAASHTLSLRSSNIVWLRISLYIAMYSLVIIVSAIGTMYNYNYVDVNLSHPRSTVRSVSNLTLESILAGDYRPVRFNGTWRGSQLLYRNPAGSLMLYDAKNNEERLLMLHDFPGLSTSHTQHVSADGRYVMLEQLHTTVYTHSRLSAYELYVLMENEEPHYLTMVTAVMHDVGDSSINI